MVMKKRLTPKNINKFIIIAAVSALCVFTGCKNASRQRKDNTHSVTVSSSCQDSSSKPVEIEIDGRSYPALNKLLVLPNNGKLAAIPWPVSLDKYLEYIYSNDNLAGYRPADNLLSFLKTIGFDGAEVCVLHIAVKKQAYSPDTAVGMLWRQRILSGCNS